MLEKIKELLESNDIKVYIDNFPQGNTPQDFVIITYKGSEPKDTVIERHHFRIDVYTKNANLQKVYTILFKEVLTIAGVGYPQMFLDIETNAKALSNFKVYRYNYSLDEIV